MPSTPCIPVIKTVVFAAQAEAVCLVGIGFLPKSERAARPAMPRRPAGPLTEFSSDRRQLLDDPRSAAEEPMVCMTLCWRETDSNFQFREEIDFVLGSRRVTGVPARLRRRVAVIEFVRSAAGGGWVPQTAPVDQWGRRPALRRARRLRGHRCGDRCHRGRGSWRWHRRCGRRGLGAVGGAATTPARPPGHAYRRHYYSAHHSY